MFDFSAVTLENIVVHSVGNKMQDEGLFFSKKELDLDDTVKALLQKYFLSPFTKDAFFNFTHPVNLDNNPVYKYAESIFENPDTFYDNSRKMAEFLYETVNHPMIKGGEFYLTLIRECLVEDELVDALGIFKSENKTTFLKVYQRDENYQIDYDNGININKLDKGCLIFNSEKSAGFKVCIVDNTNKSNEAQYWRDDFLKLSPRRDNYYQTQNFLKVCKGFVDDVFNADHEVEKPSQIEMMNSSINYFKEHTKFEPEVFTKEVLKSQPEIMEAFNQYKDNYEVKNNVQFDKEFGISTHALKEERKMFKSVLKLDRNFSVYIHGNRDFLARGVDPENGLNFYKLYYEKEY